MNYHWKMFQTKIDSKKNILTVVGLRQGYLKHVF